MAIWKYIEGDTFTHGYLKNLRKHYQTESLKNLAEYKKIKSYEKYGLPGYRWMLIHAKQNWEDDMESLDNVERAIREKQEIEDRDQDIKNNEN